jgi:uncharacterized membrane protein
MNSNRLEAFSDGVFAIIITIMVLELKVPHGEQLSDLIPLLPIFMSYVLSFIYVGIYWNNHHHMLQIVERVTGGVLWANLHLLFWISMFPFVTGWMGENHFATFPSAVYGFVLFMAGVAYWLMEAVIVSAHGKNAKLARALGKKRKEIASVILYAIAIVSTFFMQWLALMIYIIVAIMWLIPDKRVERVAKAT